MKQEQFEKIIEAQLEMIRNVLLTKQKEYATEDRLHNFRVVSGLRDCTMEQALGGMLSKHTVSIYDMIESGKEYESEQWNEKINDHIVYLLLLKAITEERRIERLMTGDYENVKQPGIKHQSLKEFLSGKGLELADLVGQSGLVYGGYVNPEKGEVDMTDNESTLLSMFNLNNKKEETRHHVKNEDTPILTNHDPESPHLTSKEIRLCMDIKELLTKYGFPGPRSNNPEPYLDETAPDDYVSFKSGAMGKKAYSEYLEREAEREHYGE